MTESPKEPRPTEERKTCDACGERPATVRIRKVTGSEEEEVVLCAGCAASRGLTPGTSGGTLVADPLAVLFQSLGETEGSGVACPGCGLTFSVFRETGRLGCARCYATFQAELVPLLRRIHGTAVHSGKAPHRTGMSYENASRLRRLNEELERAVGAEDYERAAALRDLIQETETASARKDADS
jgi:protein arginine kinase activator